MKDKLEIPLVRLNGTSDLEMPLVHLNGTSGDELLKLYQDAGHQVSRARAALHAAGPHARDYYVKGVPDSFDRAAEQHRERDKALAIVESELGSIMENVKNQVDATNAVKTTLAYMAQEALDVQDACNLSGIAHSFSRAMDALCQAGLGTDARNKHPIAIMYSSKIASLTGSEQGLGFSEAYDECKKLAEKLTNK